MTRPLLLAAGGAHVDRRGQISGLYAAGASNTGRMAEDVGGAAFNALRNAVAGGVEGAILSVRGGDMAGERVAGAIAAAGIRDLSAIFLDRASPSYTALIDQDGELIAGLADMELYETAFVRQVRRRAFRDAADDARAILVDANLTEDALLRLVDAIPAIPLHAIAVAPAKAVRLLPVTARLDCLFMNLREARALAGDPEADAVGAARALRDKGLKRGVVTAGGAPVTGFDADGFFTLEPPKPRRVADVTGAGDSVTGTAIAAMMHGRGFRQALREGLAAALITIESGRSVAGWSRGEFDAALALVPAPQAVA